MQNLRSSILSYTRIRASMINQFPSRYLNGLNSVEPKLRHCSSFSGASNDQIMDRVIRLVKKFDKIDSSKVTETAEFQKDLSLDSLDRVELVMAFEEEFSIEIPDEEADKLKCCADIAIYIKDAADRKATGNS